MSKRSAHILYLAALLGITTLAYSNSMNGPFIFDDFMNIINRQDIRLFTPTIEGVVQAASGGHSGNRWLPNISFALNYYYGQENVFGYHAVNLLVHLCTALVLYALFVITLGSPNLVRGRPFKEEIAFFGALLWAIHPIQTNSVTYMVQRMNSMCALFFLSSLLCFASARIPDKSASQKRLLYLFSVVFGFMSIVSKENAFMLPVMLLAFDLFFCRTVNWQRDRNRILAWGAASLAVIGIICVTFVGPDILTRILQKYELRDFTLTQRLLTESRVIFAYIGLLLIPHPSRLNICHDVTISSSLFSPLQTLPSVIGILALAALIPFLFNRNRLLSFALFWFLGNLAIESSIIPLELMFEHRLYLPSAFLMPLIPVLLFREGASRPWSARIPLILVVCLFAAWTWQRNLAWSGHKELWSDVVLKSPASGRGYNNLGIAYKDEGDNAMAEQLFRKAIEVEPEAREPYVSLGALYISLNRFEEANRLLRTALTKAEGVNPSRIYHYLGVLNRHTGNYPDAIQFSNMALRLEKNDLQPMINLGIVHEKLGDLKKADGIFNEAWNLGANDVDLYNNWGIVAYKLGQVDRSITLFRKGLEINPDHQESHYNLGVAYGAKGMFNEAREEMNRSMGL